MVFRSLFLVVVLAFLVNCANAAPRVSFLSHKQVASEKQKTVKMYLELSKATQMLVKVPFVVSGDARAGQDHNLKSGSAIIEPGAKSSIISFEVVDDDRPEQVEEIHVRLFAPNNARLGKIDRHTISLIDHSLDLPQVRFRKKSGKVKEGKEFKILALLSRKSEHTVIVPYSVSGTSDRDDHNLAEGTVAFAPGKKRAVISVKTHEDDVQEETETLKINFKGPAANAHLGIPYKQEVLIQDTTDNAEMY